MTGHFRHTYPDRQSNGSIWTLAQPLQPFFTARRRLAPRPVPARRGPLCRQSLSDFPMHIDRLIGLVSQRGDLSGAAVEASGEGESALLRRCAEHGEGLMATGTLSPRLVEKGHQTQGRDQSRHVVALGWLEQIVLADLALGCGGACGDFEAGLDLSATDFPAHPVRIRVVVAPAAGDWMVALPLRRGRVMFRRASADSGLPRAASGTGSQKRRWPQLRRHWDDRSNSDRDLRDDRSRHSAGLQPRAGLDAATSCAARCRGSSVL